MSIKSWSVLCLFAALLLSCRSQGVTPGVAMEGPGPLTDPSTAQQLGWSVDELRFVKRSRALSNHELLVMPQAKRERARYRSHNPKPDSPGEWDAWRRLALVDEFGQTPDNALWSARSELAALTIQGLLPTAGVTAGNWDELGPGNIGGRVRAIAIHPTNPQIMWVGSVTGGIWKTLNGGLSWSPLDDFMANLSVTSIVLDPNNSNVLYAATGEGFLSGIRGAGVFKTTDGGGTWNQLSGTANSDFYYTNRLAISANGSTLLASTNTGVYRSSNGGLTWNDAYVTGNSQSREVDFHPTDSLRAVAHVVDYDFGISSWFNTAHYTTDGGLNWTESSGLYVDSWPGRIELAYARGYPGGECIYAFQDLNEGTLFRSVDGGVSFTQVANHLITGNQGWYDLALWVEPTDTNTDPTDDLLVLGGIDLWRSADGGLTVEQISQWWQWPDSAHADQHIVIEHPDYNGSSNREVFFGNDGGVWATPDVETTALLSGWINLNNDLRITQFYGGAGDPSTGILLGGTQDNGTLRLSSGTWDYVFGGDGGFTEIDPTDPLIMYGEIQNGLVFRSFNGGDNFDYIVGRYWDGSQYQWKPLPYKIPDVENGDVNFIAPLRLDRNDPDRFYFGGKSLWRTADVQTPNTTTTGPTWQEVKPPISSGEHISAIAIAVGNSDIVWVGHNDGEVYSTNNGTAATPAWTQRDITSPVLPDRFCSSITIDPANPSRVMVTFGGYSNDNLWQTTNGGATWTAATSMPSLPLRSVEIHPTESDWLYAGSELGLLVSADNGSTWVAGSEGPANVPVDDLFWLGNTLYCVTHGRGFFSQEAVPPGTIQFRRADVDESGSVNVADVIMLLTHIFGTVAPLGCWDALDTNDDGGVDISDGVYVLGYLFGSGPAIPAPFGSCGEDPTIDGLPACVYLSCP